MLSLVLRLGDLRFFWGKDFALGKKLFGKRITINEKRAKFTEDYLLRVYANCVSS